MHLLSRAGLAGLLLAVLTVSARAQPIPPDHRPPPPPHRYYHHHHYYHHRHLPPPR